MLTKLLLNAIKAPDPFPGGDRVVDPAPAQGMVV
jgi:hypothetical protein